MLQMQCLKTWAWFQVNSCCAHLSWLQRLQSKYRFVILSNYCFAIVVQIFGVYLFCFVFCRRLSSIFIIHLSLKKKILNPVHFVENWPKENLILSQFYDSNANTASLINVYLIITFYFSIHHRFKLIQIYIYIFTDKLLKTKGSDCNRFFSSVKRPLTVNKVGWRNRWVPSAREALS